MSGAVIGAGPERLVRGFVELIADRPRVELSPSAAPGGRSAPRGDLAGEAEALAALLAEVVALAGDRAVFPGRWARIAELAMGHESVRRAMLAEEGSPVSPHRGALRWRLHQRGVVVGRGRGSRLHVRFDGETTPVSIRPYLVRVLPVTEAPALSTGHIISQLESLRDLLPASPLRASPTPCKPSRLDGSRQQMSEPPTGELTGDPWIDAYLRFRRAVLDGATFDELVTFAEELKRDLPSPTPPPPAAMFIHSDILITCGASSLSPQLVTALWVPDGALIPNGNSNAR